MKFGPHPGFDPCTSWCLKQSKHRLGVLHRRPATTPSPLCQNLDARVGIELGNLAVPILANSKQFNRLRSFPSKIRLPEAFEKIKNEAIQKIDLRQFAT